MELEETQKLPKQLNKQIELEQMTSLDWLKPKEPFADESEIKCLILRSVIELTLVFEDLSLKVLVDSKGLHPMWMNHWSILWQDELRKKRAATWAERVRALRMSREVVEEFKEKIGLLKSLQERSRDLLHRYLHHFEMVLAALWGVSKLWQIHRAAGGLNRSMLEQRALFSFLSI